MGWDWAHAFFPAVARFVANGDPYQAVPEGPFLNPPWLLPMLLPFFWLGVRWGDVAIKAFSAGGLLAVCWRYKSPKAIIIGLSFPFLYLFFNSNVDAFALWGVAIGGPLGLLLLSVKPQVAMMVGAVWVWQAFKKDGWLAAARLVWPTAAIALGSTLLYPQWPHAMLGATQQVESATLNGWPYLIPVGLVLLVVAFRTGRESLAGLATNLFSPYIRANSYVATLALIAKDNVWIGTALVLASWVFILTRK